MLSLIKKIHKFLLSIQKDAHKRKLVLFLPHGVYNSVSTVSALECQIPAEVDWLSGLHSAKNKNYI